jgi:hypothetical protein
LRCQALYVTKKIWEHTCVCVEKLNNNTKDHTLLENIYIKIPLRSWTHAVELLNCISWTN